MSKGLKIFIAMSCCCLALGSGIFNWKNREVVAVKPYSEPEWLNAFPHYPNTIEGAYSIGDEMQFNGFPMQSAYMRTDDNPRKIINFYLGVWTSQGYKPEFREYSETAWSVSVIDDKKGKILTANIVDNSTERLIMPSVNILPTWDNAGNITNRPQSIFNPPVPEGAREIHSQEMISSGLGSASKLFKVDTSIPELMDFYHKTMPAIGFKLAKQGTENNIDMLFWEAGKLSIIISFSAISEVPPVSVVSFAYLEEP